MNRAVFLDRDNTIIHADEDVSDPEHVRLILGAASAIASLRGLGYRIIVVSNQGGVAHGAFSETDVDAVNARIAALVGENSGGIIDAFYYCPHHPEGTVKEYRSEHPWRKPRAGMMRQAAEDLDLDLSACWMIGDQACDIEAGQAIEARTVFLTGSAPRRGKPSALEVEPDFIAENLVDAARVIAQQPRTDRPPRRNAKRAAGPDADTDAHAEPDKAAPSEPIEARPTPGVKTHPADPAARDAHEKHDRGSSETPLPPPRRDAPPESAPPHAEAETDPPDPPDPIDPDPLSADETAVNLLRQIRTDLRARRADHDDFSFNKMLAGVFQMIAVGCVLFGLLHLGQPALFLQWLSGAMLSQLLVITLLIAHGQRG